MKKSFVSLVTLGTLFSSAQAAMLLGMGVEADYIHSKADGHITYNGDAVTTTQFSGTTENNYQLGAYFEHPVPLLPNLRLDYTPMTFTATSTISSVGSTNLSVGNATNKIAMKYYDITPYYEILDNMVSLDIGLTIRGIDLSVETRQNANVSTSSTTVAVPMLYGAAEIKFPLTGLKANADIKYIGFSGNKYMDAKAKISYDILLGLGIEAGYRQQKFKFDQFDVNSDVTFKGPFAGIHWNF